MWNLEKGPTQLLCTPVHFFRGRALLSLLLCGPHGPPWFRQAQMGKVYLVLSYCHSKLCFGTISKPHFPQAFSFESQLPILEVNYILPLGTFLL